MKEKINHSASIYYTTTQKNPTKSSKCVGIFTVLTVSCVCKKKKQDEVKEGKKIISFLKNVMNQHDSGMVLLKAR